MSNFRVSNESGEEYSLEGLFEVASVYIGITKVEIEDEKLMFLTERGAAVPVIKWADNSCIKRRDAVDILKFQTTVRKNIGLNSLSIILFTIRPFFRLCLSINGKQILRK